MNYKKVTTTFHYQKEITGSRMAKHLGLCDLSIIQDGLIIICTLQCKFKVTVKSAKDQESPLKAFKVANHYRLVSKDSVIFRV